MPLHFFESEHRTPNQCVTLPKASPLARTRLGKISLIYT
jgi:hypothetical protein